MRRSSGFGDDSEIVGQDAKVAIARELDAAKVTLVGGQYVTRPVAFRQDHVGGVGDSEVRQVVVGVEEFSCAGKVSGFEGLQQIRSAVYLVQKRELVTLPVAS